ncbi:unnamed protein product [Zymoseptoria tritici ST99CH_1A5]|uniref:Uncharacterized protein n=2 Tax=Zymoseptoria tritici TaxID=1047171 RepID=A0A1X7RP57_ZYMT9|nr:unnamed protein product [Zymoseptoria tritici ST99CH_3D7]SMY22943.1 unnamed protein product [Zymoseptoria tritici ST99CH_1A5]
MHHRHHNRGLFRKISSRDANEPMTTSTSTSVRYNTVTVMDATPTPSTSNRITTDNDELPTMATIKTASTSTSSTKDENDSNEKNDYPYPTKAFSNKVASSSSSSGSASKPTETTISTAKLNKLNTDHRNMAIALSMFALFVTGAFALWLWLCVRKRKGKKAGGKGGRKWFGTKSAV